MNVKKEFLSDLSKKFNDDFSRATLRSFCDWSWEKSIEIPSEEYLRDFSSALIEIGTSIKIHDDQSTQHCKKMADDLYSISIDLKQATEDWKYAITEQDVKSRLDQVRNTQDRLLDALKKFDGLCPSVGLSRWLRYESSKRASASGDGKMRLEDLKGKIDFAIITIKSEEFEAVLKRFPNGNLIKGARYYSVSRADAVNGKSYLVAVTRCTSQGTGEAQDIARDIIEDLDPQWILVVGIAGGVPSSEFTLGDVVLSTRINDLTVGAVIEGRSKEFAISGGPGKKEVTNLVAFLPAMKSYLSGWNEPESVGREHPYVELRDDLIKLYGDEQWQRQVREAIKRHFGSETSPRRPLFVSGTIISSDSLIKDTEVLRLWQRTARDSLAVEMESAGIYRAARSGKREYPFLAIRGISDIVGLKRHPDWTDYACHSAAAFTLAFVRGGFIESRSCARID